MATALHFGHHARRSTSISYDTPLSGAADASFLDNNTNSSNNPNTRMNIPSGGIMDHSDNDDDDDMIRLPTLLAPHPPTAEQILAEHNRLATVYDPLNPPPDDEKTRDGVKLGLRPDAEARLFHHQTMRLGRWCNFTGEPVERDELHDWEKEMLDWKFERPVPWRRVPLRQGLGRGCMGEYLKRRNRIRRYEVKNRRAGAGGTWPRAAVKTTTGLRRGRGPQAGGDATPPSSAVSPTSFFPRKTVGGGSQTGGSVVQRAGAGLNRPTASVQSNPQKTRSEAGGVVPRGRPTAFGTSSSQAASLPHMYTYRGVPKSTSQQQQQQQYQLPGGLPIRYLQPDGQVDVSKVVSDQMGFIAAGGTTEDFFAPYPGLQDMITQPQVTNDNYGSTTSSASFSIPPPTPMRSTTRIPPHTERDNHRRPGSNPPILRTTTTTTTGGGTGTGTGTGTGSGYLLPPAGPGIVSKIGAPPASRKRNNMGGITGSGAAVGGRPATVAVKSFRLDRSGNKVADGSRKGNVHWAPLPGEEEDENDD